MTEHTPTPWYTDDPHIVGASVDDVMVYLANTNDLDTDYETSVANAAFIVKACNAHGDLLTALQMALPALEWCEKQWADSPQQGEGMSVLKIVRAVLSEVSS